jgi:hypothetical protein
MVSGMMSHHSRLFDRAPAAPQSPGAGICLIDSGEHHVCDLKEKVNP